MKIVIDTSDWKDLQDFYRAILKELGAPDWHGHNINALIDSVVYGDINSVEPPFLIILKGLASRSDGILEIVEREIGLLMEAKADHDGGINGDVCFAIE
ncbi:MAG: barstar family protein [Sphingomonas sp.]|jgi:RNAse (barnase) inhibitor barstar|uniref:barstar family protein n=1 Tax=Sphingomonas sp. TaxID=28214 RepID=UPI0035624E75